MSALKNGFVPSHNMFARVTHTPLSLVSTLQLGSALVLRIA
ncbi:MAG: hypothetical protein ACI9S7_001934 [Candidatus Paceibacteria bacterium]|jgi:hypothetical protein